MADATFKSFAGIRNTADPTRLGPEELAAAVNVDITDDKRIRRRAGVTAIVAGAAHSLYALGDLCVLRQADRLVRLFPDGTTTTLRSGLTAGGPMVYMEHGATLFASDGHDALRVTTEGVGRWGIAPPPHQPDLADAEGALPAGDYLVAVTFLRADGQESGTPAPRKVTVACGAVAMTGIPVSDDPDVTHKAVYLSTPNGRRLYEAGVLHNGDATAVVGALGAGRELETMFLQPPPASDVIGSHGGFALVGSGAFLLYSMPFRPELFDPVRRNYPMGAPLTLIASVDAGVFVGTTTGIYFLSGEMEGLNLRQVAGYGALKGSLQMVDGQLIGVGEISGRVAVFATAKGICYGLPDGSFINATQGRYEYQGASEAAGALRVDTGLTTFIASLYG